MKIKPLANVTVKDALTITDRRLQVQIMFRQVIIITTTTTTRMSMETMEECFLKFH